MHSLELVEGPVVLGEGWGGVQCVEACRTVAASAFLPSFTLLSYLDQGTGRRQRKYKSS